MHNYFNTKHKLKDGQVCFRRSPFANHVNPRRCTTEDVKPLDDTNKDVSGGKLKLTTTTACPVDCAYFCPLLDTQHYCLCFSGSCNLPSASHPPSPPPPSYIHHSSYYTQEKCYINTDPFCTVFTP